LFSNPEELTIAPVSHGGFTNTDPYTKSTRPVPLYSEQLDDMADFFDRYLKEDGERPIRKSIRYYVMGAEKWQTATSWPAPGVKPVDWYLAADHALAQTAPTGGADSYKVDLSASSGMVSRYISPADLSLTNYPGRAAQDRKLLTYTSAPLDADVELAGNPVARLMLATDATDGEVIVYLEDVWPDGRVVYLSEGVLRLSDRKITADPAAAGSSDPFHTFLAADAAPMIPGKMEPIQIGLDPIAVLLRKGHRIRVAIAGADKDNLERIPATGDPTLTITRGASSIELPVMETN
jgi:putative CocE/NonD family hydrolase